MSESICPCGHPTGSTAALCTDCKHTLEVAIVNIAAHHADLDTLRTRQVRYENGSAKLTSRSGPIGMDLRFARLGVGSELIYDTRSTIVAWTRFVEDHVTVGQGPVCVWACLHTSCAKIRRSRPPADTIASCCRYLLGWADWLRTAPQGVEALDELCDLEHRLQRLVDRPPDRWYAGPCGADLPDGVCAEPLYAKAEKGVVECRACGATINVPDRRAWLLAAAEDHHATATTIARAVLAWTDHDAAEGRLVDRIRKWGERHRIRAKRHEWIDGRPRPLYRLGDVLDLMAEDARHAEEARLRRAG